MFKYDSQRLLDSIKVTNQSAIGIEIELLE